MAFDDGTFHSRMVGDLNLSPDDAPDEPTAMLLELNVLFPGGQVGDPPGAAKYDCPPADGHRRPISIAAACRPPLAAHL